MTKISLDLNETLNRRLKQFTLNKYGRTHGRQQMVIKDALIAYLDAQESKSAEAVEREAAAEEPIPAAARTIKPRKAKKVAAKKFKDDAEAIAKVKQQWEGGERNIAAIAKQFPQYTYRSIHYWISKEIERGGLSKEVPAPSTS